MILTSPEIQKQVQLRRIIIEPFSPSSLNPNSYNYHLGSELIIFSKGLIYPKCPTKRLKIPKSGYLLNPGKLYLGHTIEEIGSNHYVTSLIGRSTMGRLGLWLQVTADLGHQGAHHHWTLEMKVVQPLRLFAGMPIGQVTFWHIFGPQYHLYEGKYASDVLPQPSKLTELS